MHSADQYLGCVLGLAFGDALGAPCEGGALERALWLFIGRTSHGEHRWTDDTQMALDLAEVLMTRGRPEPHALASQFAASYRWSRGYGQGTARVLRRVRGGMHWSQASRTGYPHGSYGNGAAMRSPILALFYASDRAALVSAARQSAEVTHAHPLGIEGAVAIAAGTHECLLSSSSSHVITSLRELCESTEFRTRLDIAAAWIQLPETRLPREVVSRLGNGIAAHASVVTAVYIALQHRTKSFDAMLRYVRACGGDVDTIGAMAGALWGATNGSSDLPPAPLEARDRLERVAAGLFHHSLRSKSA